MPARNDYGGRIRYVTVTAMHYINGLCCPQVLETDGGAFLIEGVVQSQKLPGQDRNYGAQERFLVKIKGKERYLYRNGQMWFIIPQKDDQLLFGMVGNSWRY